jgi:hypothetical protein
MTEIFGDGDRMIMASLGIIIKTFKIKIIIKFSFEPSD